MAVFFFYNERDVLKSLAKKEKLSAVELKAIGEATSPRSPSGL
jgi:hypothetical protein